MVATPLRVKAKRKEADRSDDDRLYAFLHLASEVGAARQLRDDAFDNRDDDWIELLTFKCLPILEALLDHHEK